MQRLTIGTALVWLAVGLGCNGNGNPIAGPAAKKAAPGGAPAAPTTSGSTTSPTSPTKPVVYATVSDIGDPSGMEQELVELANRARRDPVAEGNLYGLNFAGIPAMPPLAPNGLLAKAALGHTTDMAVNKYFAHVDPKGLDPAARITAAGYTWAAEGENIWAQTPSAPDDAKQCHAALIIDSGINPPGHRYNILGYGSAQALYREVGCSLLQNNVAANGSPQDSYATQDFGCRTVQNPLLTGVVFADANGSGEYDAGEGVAGVTVKLTPPGGSAVTTTSKTAGGFAFEIQVAGKYTIEMSGGPLTAPVSAAVTIGTVNVKVDAVVGTGIVVR